MNQIKNHHYPISMLSTFIAQIDQLTEVLEQQRTLLLEEKNKPNSLNNDFLNRLLLVLQKNAEHIFLYYEQLIKWQKETLSNTKKDSLNFFSQKISQTRELNANLIDLVKEINELTINKLSNTLKGK